MAATIGAALERGERRVNLDDSDAGPAILYPDSDTSTSISANASS
jgi:hypothetical protein